MTKGIYRGFLRLRCRSEGDDALCLDDREPLAATIQDDIALHGRYLSVRYYTSAVELGEQEIRDEAVRVACGVGQAEWSVAWSEDTGYLWTTEELMVGGHDLLEELKSHAGRFCQLEIGYSADPVPV